ncbi:hypothetical protein FRC20_001587 [Serendipita sp. 405]|nr:hypothetical protein FRC20_001587 [Serendipita sp. 405]
MAAISVAAKASFRRTLIDLGDQGEHFEEAIKLLETIFCPSGAWQDRTGHHILASLQNYSLASQTSASETILLRVHPLIHSWANDRISPERRSVLKAAACRLLACACEELVLESHIIAHINAILRTPESICLNDKGGFSKKLDEATGQHTAWTMWESIYQELLERHGPTNRHVATAALEWGKVFKEDLSKAEDLMTNAVGVFSSVLGSDDAETIKASLELSGLFRIRGQYPKAETVQREMIDICLEKFGENHEVTISAKSMLSITLRKTYRFTDAEKLQRDVLRQRISQYGEFHSLTFSSMEELGVLAFSLNHNEEAARIFSDLLEKQEKALGKEHLETVATRSCLASVRFNQGRYVEAEQMYRQFLKDSLKTGSTHSDVIIAMSNLAKTLMKLEKYAEAARLQRRALVLGIKLLGRLHHSTVCKVAALAETYIRQKRYVRCNKLLSIAFAEVEQHYGRGHQTTLFIVHRLSQLYARTRRLHKAVEFGRLALFERSRQLGETHPGTIQSAENLLDVYLRMGRYRPALLLLFKWTQGAIRDYGESDRRTLQPIVALGKVLRDTKRFRDAEKVQLYALDLAMGLSGNKIEACRAEFLGMASTYDSQGRYFQAKALRDRLLEDWDPTELNEEYVRALLDQSGTLYRTGQKKQAQALWDKFMNYVASLGEANETEVLKILGKVKKRREFQSPRSLQVRRFRLIGTRKRA